MSGTALNHPLVADYLRELDAALAVLPARQAGELREQITSHLDDVLGHGASDRETAEALLRLGSPRDLAAEARAGAGAGAGSAAALAPQASRSPARRFLARLGWRSRILIVAAVLGAAAVTWYSVTAYTVGALAASGDYGWWYPQDAAHQVETSADGAHQSSVQIRSGERQGLYVAVVNPSPWAQTVLGYAGNFDQGPGSRFAQLRVAARLNKRSDSAYGLGYQLPGVIPPYSWRYIRVMWTSGGCLQAGGGEGIDQLVLNVRVGVFHRTEVVPLPEGFFLSGPGDPAVCPRVTGGDSQDG